MRPFKSFFSRSTFISLLGAVVAFTGTVTFLSNASAACLTIADMNLAQGAGVYETCGGDDIAYRVPLAGDVVFGGETYSSIYASTNSAISFGRNDPTWWDFPSAPSIAFQNQDWVEAPPGSPYWGPSDSEEFFNITTTESGFVVDLSGRRYPNIGGLIRNVLAFVRYGDGTLNIQSFSSSSESQYRNGCRLGEQSQGFGIVDFETCGITRQVSLEAISLFVEVIENNEIVNPPVEEGPLAPLGPLVEKFDPDPVQQSQNDSSSGLLSPDGTTVDITIIGNFIETVRSIQTNGKKISHGSWIQNPDSITFSALKSDSGSYTVQIFNGSVPLLEMLTFSLVG